MDLDLDLLEMHKTRNKDLVSKLVLLDVVYMIHAWGGAGVTP